MSAAIEQSFENNSNVVVSDNTQLTQPETEWQYDSQGNNHLVFEIDGKDITHCYTTLSDERYIAYANALDTALGSDDAGKALEINCALFDELVENLLGYEDLPADWKKQLDPLDKQFSVNHFLAAAAYFETEAPATISKAGKAKFGKKNIVTLESYWGVGIAKTHHTMQPKTLDHIKEYQKVLQRSFKTKESKGLKGQSRIFVLDVEGMAELYDKYCEKALNYKNDDVPVWHKVPVVTFYYGKELDEKK